MTPFFHRVRQRLHIALPLAFCAFSLPSTLAIADDLDDAIAIVQQRKEAPLFTRSMLSQPDAVPVAKLSPDGHFLAYVVDLDLIKQVRLFATHSGQHRTLFSTKMLKGLSWSSDSNFLFMETEQGVGMTSMDAPAQPAHVINLAAKKEETFYGADATHPHAFIASQQAADRTSHTIYRVLPDGQRTPLYTSASYVADFLPSEDNTPHFAIQIGGNGLDVLRIEPDKTQPLFRCLVTDNCGLLSFNPSSGTLYMRGRFGDDLAGLYAINAQTGAHRRLHRDPKGLFDLESVKVDPHTGDPVLVGYKDDHTSFYGLTPRMEAIVTALNTHLSASYYHIEPSTDASRLLITDQSADQPFPKFMLYTPATDEMQVPLSAQTDAKKRSSMQGYLAPRVAVWYTVSDGMRQQGYVTLPLGKDPQTAPLVVVPHGGPWGRTDGSFDTRAQFLANRGYAVFEPNFRASTGFGHKYMTSGRRAFGDGRVQQDIIDGMKYVLARGVGDPEKLAIFGHSFGGFSVLGALAFTPKVFRVGIAGAPPPDLGRAITHYRKTRDDADLSLGLEFYKDQAVDPDDPEDMKRIHQLSPDYQWQQVTKPLYVWAGAKDPKVSVLDIRNYVLRLQHAGKTVTYFEEAQAGHSPSKAIEREAYFYMLEKALATHLDGRMEISVSDKLHRHLKRITTLDATKE